MSERAQAQEQAQAPTLAQRLTLERVGEGRWRSRHGDANQNGRSYGGQLLGQAMQAALLEMPPQRPPTAMQFLFLQGAMPDRPVDLAVERLQDGKRFSSVRVSGTQGARTVLDAQVTCALPLDGPAHDEPSTAPPAERPADLPGLEDVPLALRDRIALMGGYGRDCNASIAFRIPDAQVQFAAAVASHRFRYWMKVPEPLPDGDARLQASAFAYLSDWWLNFCILRTYLPRAGERPMYVSSLNHALWLHRPPRSDQWLHVEASGVHAGHGRGLAVARYHDEQGRHVASATQDCLFAFTD